MEFVLGWISANLGLNFAKSNNTIVSCGIILLSFLVIVFGLKVVKRIGN